MMHKVLPLEEPIVDAYPGYAASLSVLLTRAQGREWFVENYLNLYALYDLENEFFYVDYLSFRELIISSMHHCQLSNVLSPLINVYSYPLDHVSAHSPDIIDVIRDEIDNNRYIYMYINRRLIKEFRFEWDYSHETFVYGYDDERELVYLKDYIGGKYVGFTCSYDDLRSAASYSDIGNNVDYGIFQQKVGSKLSTFEYKGKPEYKLSKLQLTQTIEAYLSGHVYRDVQPVIFSLTADAKREELYGINHYYAFIRYFSHCLSTNNSIDERVTHFFYTHKKCIAYKVQYFVDKGIAPPEMLADGNKLIKTSLLIRNYALKHNLKKGSNGGLGILKTLYSLMDQERTLLKKMSIYLNNMVD